MWNDPWGLLWNGREAYCKGLTAGSADPEESEDDADEDRSQLETPSRSFRTWSQSKAEMSKD